MLNSLSSLFPCMKHTPVPHSYLWPFAGLAAVCPFLSSTVQPRTGYGTPDVISPVLCRESTSLDLLPVFFPKTVQDTLPQGCSAGSRLVCCPVGPPPNPFLHRCCAAAQPSVCSVPGVIPPPGAGLCISYC